MWGPYLVHNRILMIDKQDKAYVSDIGRETGRPRWDRPSSQIPKTWRVTNSAQLILILVRPWTKSSVGPEGIGRNPHLLKQQNVKFMVRWLEKGSHFD